jgi:hypothetical protein
MEIFDAGADGKGRDYEMGAYAQNAMKSMRKFLEKCAE